MRVSIWPAIHPRILELIRSHRSTLVFVNSRRLAERLAQRLNELAGEDLVRAHHGSIAREQRVAIEEALKEGRLPALVATSSLELGIDMGAIDLVIQVESPTSVARGLQRIGRAGHQVDEVSIGVIFPKYRGDLLECAVVAERMREGAIEATTVPRTPLDVLAQQIVAMTVMDRWSVADLHAVVARAMPFETLTREALEGVLAMLAGAYPSDEFAELKPRLTWDRVTDTVEGRRDARVVAVTSGGTIPDRGLYGVFVAGEAGTPGRRVGELDEEMVYELRAGMHGDVIVLGASSWRVAEITPDRVIVEPAPGQPGKLPFWKGDARRPPDRAGPRAGGVRARGRGRPRPRGEGAGGRAGAPARAPPPRPAGGREPRRLPGGRARGGRRPADRPPHRRRAVPRRARRLAAGPAHARSAAASTPRGRWRSRPACASGWAPRCPASGRTTASPSACRTATSTGSRTTSSRMPTAWRTWWSRPSAGPRSSRPASARTRRGPCSCRAAGRERGRRSGSSASAPRTCSRWPAGTAASRSSSRPTASAWPTSSTCRRCATCCAGWSAARSPSTASRRRGPRPFASSLLFDYVAAFMYEGDAPLAERRAQALALDRDLLRELLGQEELRELLDPAALEETELERQALVDERKAGSVDQVADLLRRLGDLSADEVAARTRGGSPAAGEWLETLAATRRAIAVRIAGEARWIAVEDAARYRDATGAQPPPGTPTAFLGETRDALGGLLARWARTHGPFLAAEPARRWGLPVGIVEEALTRLVGGGIAPARRVPAGRRRAGVVRPGRAAAAAPALAGAAATRGGARGAGGAGPVPAGLAGRGGGAGAGDARGRRPAAAARPGRPRAPGRGRRPAGRRADPGLGAGARRAAGPRARLPAAPPRRAGRARRGGLGRLRAARPRRRADRPLPAGTRRRPAGGARRRPAGAVAERPDGPRHAAIREWLARRGASFYRELFGAAGGGSDREVLDALWDLVWAGEVTNDTFAPLRALRWKRPGRRPAAAARPPGDARAARGGGSLVAGGAAGAGGDRAAGASAATGAGSVPATPGATERLHALALALLDRHGVLTREAVIGEGVEGGFAGVYPVLRALEEAGRIRRGYFVDGLGAAQFALAGAIDRLRAAREPDAERPRVDLLAAADPAQPYGAALPWPRRGDDDRRPFQRAAGAYVVLVDGAAVLYVERGGKGLATFPAADDPERAGLALAALGGLLGEGRLRELVLSRVDGAPLGPEHPWRARLVEAGFVPGYRGMALRPRR